MNLMTRRLAGLIVAAVGVAFLVSLVVNNLFTVGPAFERMSDGFRPIMKPAPLALLQRDLDGLNATGTEFAAAVPALATALNSTPAQLNAAIEQQYPAVSAGMKNLPGTVQSFQGVLNTLKAEQTRFASADAIPTTSLPATTVPWGMLVAGVLLIVVGLGIAFTRGLAAPITAVLLGAALVIGPLVMSLPQKASAADTMNAHLKPVYTSQMVAGAEQSLAGMQAMGTQMGQLLPALGRQLGLSSAELQTYLQQNLPATASALKTMPASMARFQSVVGTFRAHLSDYNAIKDVSFVPIVWTLIAGGGLVFLAGLLGMVRRRPQALEAVRPQEVPRAA